MIRAAVISTQPGSCPALPGCRYDGYALKYLHIAVVEDSDVGIVGVAASDPLPGTIALGGAEGCSCTASMSTPTSSSVA